MNYKQKRKQTPPSNGLFIPMEAEIEIREWEENIDAQMDISIYMGTFTSNSDYDWSEDQFEQAMRQYHNYP